MAPRGGTPIPDPRSLLPVQTAGQDRPRRPPADEKPRRPTPNKSPARDIGGKTSMRALLHWTFAVQKADQAMEWASKATPADYLAAASADGVWAVGRQAALGARVDCVGSAGLDRGALHPDAEAAYLIGRGRLPWKLFARVAHHARTDSVPDWGQGLQPVRAAPNMVWTRIGNHHYLEPQVKAVPCGPRSRKGRQAVQRWCPVIWKDERAAIDAARAYYAEWHAALCEWMAGCAGRLSYWQVDGIGADGAPWTRETKPAKTLDTERRT